MQVTTQQTKESILCSLPDGRQVEIIMVNMIGEDCEIELDLPTALKMLQYYLKHPQSSDKR